MVHERKPVVVADHREALSGVPHALEEIGVTVNRATLRIGDYAIGFHTRVERKTVIDLHTSVASGRFWRQLNELRATSAFPVVLVEGARLDEGPLAANRVRGVLVALADRGVPVVRSIDAKDSALWIRTLALARSASKRVRDPTAVAMLCAIPSVSVPVARRLIDAFGNLREIANASQEELMTVTGVGHRRSGAIHEAVTQPSYRIPRPRDPDRAT